MVYLLQPVSYRSKTDPSKEYIGFVAEDVAEIEPRLVVYGPDGSPDALQYANFTALLAKAVQDQKILIDQLIAGQSVSSAEPLAVSDSPASAVGSLAVMEAATFYGTITVYGEADFTAKVTFKDHVYFDDDTAGIARITANSTSTEIVFAKPYERIPVITVTPKGNAEGVDYWVADESEKGFRIAINPVSGADLSFNWHALVTINGQVAGATESIEPEITVEVVDPGSVADGGTPVEPPVAGTIPEALPEPVVEVPAEPATEIIVPEIPVSPEPAPETVMVE